MILICYYHIMLLLTYWRVICLQVPDVMDQHASSFKVPDQAFKPRILKTDAQSRLRNLRVYHPPRRKSRSCDIGDLHVRKIYKFVASLSEKHWFNTDDWSLQRDPTFWLYVFRFHFNFIPLCPFHFVDGFYCMLTSSVYISCLSVKATCLSRFFVPYQYQARTGLHGSFSIPHITTSLKIQTFALDHFCSLYNYQSTQQNIFAMLETSIEIMFTYKL